MNRKLKFIIMAGLYSVSGYSRSEMGFCVRTDSVIYDSPKGIFIVNFKDKLLAKKLDIPEDILKKIQRSNKTNILECDQTKFRVINESIAHEFTFDKNENLEFIKSHPYKTSKSMKSLGDLSKGHKLEFYKDNKIKVHFEPSEREERPKEYSGAIIFHHYTNRLIKMDMISGKKIDELIIFEGTREETVD